MDGVSRSSVAEHWRERIVEQRSSGLGIRAWCRENGCHEHSFYWWRVRLKLHQSGAVGKRRRAGVARRDLPLSFAKVRVVPPVVQPTVLPVVPSLCLRLAGGRELILPGSMPIEQVARLVRLIEDGIHGDAGRVVEGLR